MPLFIRPIDKTNIHELRYIAEMDSKIPLEYDSEYGFSSESINRRMELYQQLTPGDFFEVAVSEKDIVAFHIIKVGPYPPNLKIGNVITLWVHPDFRAQGLAAKLKSRAEEWATSQNLSFLQTQVHVLNSRMLEINRSHGFKDTYINLRKKL